MEKCTVLEFTSNHPSLKDGQSTPILVRYLGGIGVYTARTNVDVYWIKANTFEISLNIGPGPTMNNTRANTQNDKIGQEPTLVTKILDQLQDLCYLSLIFAY